MRVNILKATLLLLILTLALITFIPLENSPFSKLQPAEISLQCARSVPKSCDIFSGKWVPSPKGPYYTNKTGCVIQDGQNCIKYGRPDTEFIKWRWKPDGCELAVFNGVRFLELLRGKSMAFVGDSLARNQMQSLGCLLSGVSRFVDGSKPNDQSFRRWLYPDYDFTLTHMRSTHLVEARGADNSSAEAVVDLYLDEVDKSWSSQVENFDYVIISCGHWFSKTPLMYHENRTLVGCSKCRRRDHTADLTMFYGYRLALETAFKTLVELENFKGTVILRTISPTHSWEDGGECARKKPFARGEMKFDWLAWGFRMVQLEQFRVAEREVMMERRGSKKFRLLDITEAMRMRPDGHPNHYGHPPEKKKMPDCLHWCLPGPIDAWNELLFQMLNTEENKS